MRISDLIPDAGQLQDEIAAIPQAQRVALALRPGCAQSACSGRGVFSVIGDVLGTLALFAVLVVLASFGA
ncbi:hypothetical protein ROSMUCSMR3_03578 [Roseovarius mucosus]|uniref:Uncharacterized protein n=1 Tax=Roseovarius mucosus TaxID=215743 RepID=A0A1V0RTT6_9RHOB|nr:hypothetical protein [Roseovarius mucosus]ARE85032.1 hypothetical protein ROSMUCSMR3_03578 [Roseovarius mucosus]